MTSQEFVIWMKGFTEACHEFHPTPKQWDRLKEVLNEVQDYDDNPGLDAEIDDWYSVSDKIPGQPRGSYKPSNLTVPPTGTITVSGSGSLLFTALHGTTAANTVWNDQMGCWHFTNYPEGFGYYTNSTLKKETPEETKKQLLD